MKTEEQEEPEEVAVGMDGTEAGSEQTEEGCGDEGQVRSGGALTGLTEWRSGDSNFVCVYLLLCYYCGERYLCVSHR